MIRTDPFKTCFGNSWLLEFYKVDQKGNLMIEYHGLEAGVELDKEGRFESHGQHPPLHHRTLNIIILSMDSSIQLKQSFQTKDT